MKEETFENMIGGTRCPGQQAEQDARLHENEQTPGLQSNEQAASQLSNEQEAILLSDQQGASQLSDPQEAILQGDQQAEGQLNDNQTDGLHAETQAEEQDDLLPAEIFLREHCEFRYNVLADKIEVRARKGGAWGPWHYLDKMEFNSIVVAARRAMPKERGLKAQMQDSIYSSSTPTWDPIAGYLQSLPAWDGRDRVMQLLLRIPGITAQQVAWAHVWLLSMVVHWLQQDQLHANELVLTLIGAQGGGKSTFLRRLLPEHLREYYLDHVNLGNKFDKEMALTNNLLVNLDELDQVRPSQQAELKQMVSKVRVNGRRIWGSNQSDRSRYASFAATTNNRHPLNDPTGSRRYLCVEVEEGKVIDNVTPIEYEQFFAQLCAELQRGERYWFTDEETLVLQKTNCKYQNSLDLTTMVESCFRLPREDEFTPDLSTDAILDIIAKAYPSVHKNASTRVQLGIVLTRLGYERKDGQRNHSYYVVVK